MCTGAMTIINQINKECTFVALVALELTTTPTNIDATLFLANHVEWPRAQPALGAPAAPLLEASGLV